MPTRPNLPRFTPDSPSGTFPLEGTTTAALLTPRGRGAVATIRITGELSLLDNLFIAANGQGAERQTLNRIAFGSWGMESPEDVVFVRTGEQSAEVHCHGGLAAVERILNDLREQGVGIVESGSQDRLPRVDSECREALLRATTQRSAHHLLRQLTLFPQALRQLYEQFSVQMSGTDGSSIPSAAIQKAALQLDEMIPWGRFGIRLSEGWKIVLCGRPNVGKSSLMNRLAGFARSIVSDQPGTTRDVVQFETALEGWPVRLSDTAGLRESAGEIESAGIQRARAKLAEADVVVLVLDATIGWTDEDRDIAREFPEVLPIWNRCDLADPPGVGLAVSALTGQGQQELIEQLVSRLVPAEPGPFAPFPITPAQSDLLHELHEFLRRKDGAALLKKLESWLTVDNSAVPASDSGLLETDRE